MIGLSLRLARRELKGSLGGFRVFLACLALGVATIAGAGSLDTAMRRSLSENARALLGGDAALVLTYRQPSADETAFLGGFGTLSQSAEMRAMAANGETRTLVELRGVDAAYPLYGTVELVPAGALAPALAQAGGEWGAAADPDLLDRLGLHVGDVVRVGEAQFRLRATIAREPDRVAEPFSLGPRLLVDGRAIAATGLVQPGSLVRYVTLLRLNPGLSVSELRRAVDRRFPETGWLFRDAADAAPGLKRFLDDMTLFLTLVGLTTLLVGGIGVADGVRAFMESRIPTIAVLKCLGAPRNLILAAYGWQVAAVGTLGIAAGLVIGALVPYAATAIWGDSLPIAAATGLYLRPLGVAALFGALTVLTFAAWPLARASEVSPATLFRDIVAPGRARIRGSTALVIGVAGVGLAALAIFSAADAVLAAWFVGGSALALGVFAAAGRGLTILARRAALWRRERPGRLPLRLALSSLHRPGAPTAGVVLSLGLGLTVLVTVALVEADMSRQLDERLPKEAPTFFFIDIPSGQSPAFDRAIAAAGGRLARRAPMVRGRITRLNGVPVEQARIAADAQWAIRGDRGLTTAATRPDDARLVAGDWWPADWNGPPLVSLDAGIARGFGLGVGDSITVNVLGREITAKIASLREIDWSNLSMNFTFIMTPNALAGAPHSDIASVYADPGKASAVERAVAKAVPSASAIRVSEALAEIKGVMSGAATAIRVAAAVTLVAGGLVLAGAIAAGRQRRLQETVLLKVLGARRADLLGALTLEYLLLGMAAAIVAAALGSGAAWGVVVHVLRTDWTFLPMPVAVTAIGAVAAVTLLGLAMTARVLAARAAPYLRHE